MKIAIICPYDYKNPGGVQIHIRDCAKELSNLGHEITVISPRTEADQSNTKDHVTFGYSRKFTFNKTNFDISFVYGAEYKKLKFFLKNNEFEIIHYHTIWTPFLPLQILYLSKSKNVATFHDTPPDNFSGNLTRLLFRFASIIISRYLDAIIVVSDTPMEHLSKNINKTIHVIPPCTDLKRFSPDNLPLIKKTGNKIDILFFGRLDQRKGIFILLEAFKKIIRDGIEARLLVAGTGHEQSRLVHYLEKEKLDTIKFIGRIADKDKPSLYTSCDLFCSPALYGESFGIVLVEAMASGKPVVAAANKGYRLLLQEQSEYCLTTPGDSEDLYLKLKKLVLDKKLREELGAWGLRKSKQYDCEQIIPEILDIYKETLNFK